MTKELELTKFYEICNRGQLKPAILGDELGNRYYVKFKDHPLVAKGDAAKRKELVNEFLCAKLATQLKLNCPAGYSCCISDSVKDTLQKEYPKIEKDYPFQLSTGLHYAKKVIPDARQCTAQLNRSFDGLDRIKGLTKLIVFELALVHNSDLQDDNFLLDVSNDLWVVDHGNCFGGAWNAESLTELCYSPRLDIENRFTCATHLWHMAKTGNELLAAANEIRDSIVDGDIHFILESVPPEWLPGPEERDVLEKFLKHRRNALPELVK